MSAAIATAEEVSNAATVALYGVKIAAEHSTDSWATRGLLSATSHAADKGKLSQLVSELPHDYQIYQIGI
jgi:hypothetical protein